MSASFDQVFNLKNWYRLWTTLFVHADPKHLLSNSLLFFILGYFLSGYFGALLFPISAIFAGGIVNLIVLSKMPEQVMLIGMSGVVFWMGGLWLTLYLLIDRVRSLWQRSLRSFGVGLALFFPGEAFSPQISYQSHLVGFILGVLCGFIFFFIYRRQFRQSEVVEWMREDESDFPTKPVNDNLFN